MQQHFGIDGSDGQRLPSMARTQIGSTLRHGFPDLVVYDDSGTSVDEGVVFAARDGDVRKLLVCGEVDGFTGIPGEVGGVPVLVCDAPGENLARLRGCVEWLRPILTGMKPSVGLGDRLGLATPGHIAAGGDSGFVLVLAQQSVREMTRTARSAQQVMDEAVFGVFETGYDRGFGSDADHLKTTADVDMTAAVGFTGFTIDPSDFVDDTVDHLAREEVVRRFQKLIDDGVPGAFSWRDEYAGRTFTVGSLSLSVSEEDLYKAAVKYGRAVAHCEAMATHIRDTVPVSEIELSVDETECPTSVFEHLFVAREMQRRGVRLNSLAPRFVGSFEKGVDYKGDLAEFEARLKEHTEIADNFGPYKISVHSGSDKFDVYPIVARVTGGRFHLKTAGTSYLEALRVVARHEPRVFREIVEFCRSRFETDRATYHISAELKNVPDGRHLPQEDLERVYLDQDDGRQILHVTFGSVLTARERGDFLFRERLLSLVTRESSTYVEVLTHHIGRHVSQLRPMVTDSKPSN